MVMFKEYGIQNSYTLECSLCGPNIGSKKDFHYSKRMLIDMGKSICVALADLSDQAKQRNALREI